MKTSLCFAYLLSFLKFEIAVPSALPVTFLPCKSVKEENGFTVLRHKHKVNTASFFKEIQVLSVEQINIIDVGSNRISNTNILFS